MDLVVQKVTGDNVGTEIRNILKEVDKNGDGRIDYEEFCDMMRQAGAFLCYVYGSPAAYTNNSEASCGTALCDVCA